MKTRPIEMAYCSGVPGGQWDTEIVEIPVDTPEEQIETAGRVAMEQWHDSELTAGFWLYNSMDDECPEEDKVPERSDVLVVLSFDLDQITEGSETEQQATAVEQINLYLQREPHGLGASIVMVDK